MSEQNARLERLGRLLAIRDIQAQRDRRAFQMAAGAVAEVDGAIAVSHQHAADAVEAGRSALDHGDRESWLYADARREAVGSSRAMLHGLRAAREAEVPPAMAQVAVSRLEQEQVKVLLAAARAEAAKDEDRRAQAYADDSFLSRRLRVQRAAVKAL